jgi:uncharacterized Zn-finger protein
MTDRLAESANALGAIEMKQRKQRQDLTPTNMTPTNTKARPDPNHMTPTTRDPNQHDPTATSASETRQAAAPKSKL